MAIVNNAFFRALISTTDSTGAAEISNADRVNIIGGGAVDEQTIILENANHAYSTVNRRVLCNAWSGGAASSSTSRHLFKETGASLVIALEWPARVGADRQNVACLVHYQGIAKVEIFSSALASLDSNTFGASATPTTATANLTWSTTESIIVRVSLSNGAGSDGYLWGVRLMENQTAL